MPAGSPAPCCWAVRSPGRRSRRAAGPVRGKMACMSVAMPASRPSQHFFASESKSPVIVTRSDILLLGAARAIAALVGRRRQPCTTPVCLCRFCDPFRRERPTEPNAEMRACPGARRGGEGHSPPGCPRQDACLVPLACEKGHPASHDALARRPSTPCRRAAAEIAASRPHMVVLQDAADCGPPRLSSCIHPRPPSSESPLAFRRTARISMRGAAGSASSRGT